MLFLGGGWAIFMCPLKVHILKALVSRMIILLGGSGHFRKWDLEEVSHWRHGLKEYIGILTLILLSLYFLATMR